MKINVIVHVNLISSLERTRERKASWWYMWI